MKTKLVNLKTCPKRIDGGVYIGRGSKWGNPFVIGKDGDRQTVIAKYKRALWCNKVLLHEVEELRGKTLLCFCAPAPCHGHVLIAALDWLEQQEKTAVLDQFADDLVRRPKTLVDDGCVLEYGEDANTQQALALHDGAPT